MTKDQRNVVKEEIYRASAKGHGILFARVRFDSMRIIKYLSSFQSVIFVYRSIQKKSQERLASLLLRIV